MSNRTYVSLSVSPSDADTTCRILPPDTHHDGTPREITVLQLGPQLLLQWTTPADALAWLDSAATLVADRWALNRIERANLQATS